MLCIFPNKIKNKTKQTKQNTIIDFKWKAMVGFLSPQVRKFDHRLTASMLMKNMAKIMIASYSFSSTK